MCKTTRYDKTTSMNKVLKYLGVASWTQNLNISRKSKSFIFSVNESNPLIITVFPEYSNFMRCGCNPA